MLKPSYIVENLRESRAWETYFLSGSSDIYLRYYKKKREGKTSSLSPFLPNSVSLKNKQTCVTERGGY